MKNNAIETQLITDNLLKLNCAAPVLKINPEYIIAISLTLYMHF